MKATTPFDENYWNERYLNHQTGWDIGFPSTPIATYIDQLTSKDLRILIPGCGNAHEGAYLLERGFKNVFLLDISELALKNVMEKFPKFNASHFIHGDFFEHQGQYDLILEQTFFCALHPTLRVAYVQKMNELSAPNGTLTGLLFNCELNADKPPFSGYKADYLELFGNHFEHIYMETAYNSIPQRAERELFIKLKK